MSLSDNNTTNCNNDKRMELSGKVQNRTHHTRFFEKLYGNLDKSENEKIAEKLTVESVKSDIAISPSESSASSSEMYGNELNASRCVQISIAIN